MGQNGSTTIIFLILMVAVFYFLLIRPQRKRQQEALRMQSALTPGSRVMTTAGMYATVTSVDDGDVTLEIAPGVECLYVKAAIARVVEAVEDETELEDDTDTEAEGVTPAEPKAAADATAKNGDSEGPSTRSS